MPNEKTIYFYRYRFCKPIFMDKSIRYKALHKRLHFRNPESIIENIENYQFDQFELEKASAYLADLEKMKINWVHPEHVLYPKAFLSMKEPPLFIEYIGLPCWTTHELFSVVGARKLHVLSQQWMDTELVQFLTQQPLAAVVSGGAYGVDVNAHLAAIKAKQPTVVVLPCGLGHMYPEHLYDLQNEILKYGGVYFSEFEFSQGVKKINFFFRNRLIAALGKICLVVQAGVKSGTMLTVHHALENGRPVFTLPSHPCLNDFKGNMKLISEGAPVIFDAENLGQIWRAELWSSY